MLAAAALSGAVWFRWYARLLGARIGEGVDLHALPPVTGWLDVGAGAAIEPEVDLLGYWIDGDRVQVGPITIGDIALDEDGEEVFREGRSIIWKQLVVKRIYDAQNETLIYLSHSRQVQEGSAKMSLSTVPLYGQDVTWANGAPE